MEYVSTDSLWNKTTESNEDLQCILVTGGSGLIGSNVRDVLMGISANSADFIEANQLANSDYGISKLEKWVFLSSKDGDLRDAEVVKSLFRKYKPTMVLHLAAKVGGLYANMANNLDFFRDNMMINDNVLHTSYEMGVKKVVSCLSTCIFPDKTTYPIDETMVHNGPPHESNFGYSYAKRMIDIQNRAYNQKTELERIFTSIIPCNIFGPWDNYDLKESHVIPGLIHKMYLADKKGDSSYTIMGSGTPLRQFIYSRDLAKLLILIMRVYRDPEPIVLSVDEKDEVPIKTVSEMIASNFKNIKTINTNTMYPDGQFKKTANNDKLRDLVPEFKFTPLDVAVRESVNWFVENYDTGKVRLGSN